MSVPDVPDDMGTDRPGPGPRLAWVYRQLRLMVRAPTSEHCPWTSVAHLHNEFVEPGLIHTPSCFTMRSLATLGTVMPR